MNQKLVIVHPFTPYSPGHFLQEALQEIGFEVSLFDQAVDFGEIDLCSYDGVLFIENAFKADLVQVSNIDKVKIPKLFWVFHGQTRFDMNYECCKMYQIDSLLLGNGFHLATKYGTPLRFLPLAVAPRYFKNNLRLKKRMYDISFIGSYAPEELYHERNMLLEIIHRSCPRLKIHFSDEFNLAKMANVYANSKIVFNWNYDQYLTQRLFEGMGSGALMLTNSAQKIKLIGENRLHYVLYRHPADLIHKITFYLSHLTKAQEVADNGYKKIMSEHTYVHRALKIKKILEEYQ